MKPIEIFRAGRHASEIGIAQLDAIAQNYDARKHEAPITKGHPQDNAPAYGWIADVYRKGNSLFAIPRQIDGKFADEVHAGRYKKISASFYKPGAKANPSPASYALRHVGFLGAEVPAVKGMQPVVFDDSPDEYLSAELLTEGDKTMNLAERIGHAIIDAVRKVTGKTDHFAENELTTNQGVSKALEELAKAFRVTTEKPATNIESKDMSEREEELKRREQALEELAKAFRVTTEKPATNIESKDMSEREEELKRREQALEERETKAARASSEECVEGLIKAGKVLPAHKETVINLLERIKTTDTIVYSEDGNTVTKNAKDAVKALLGSLPVQVHFGEVATPEKQSAATAGFVAPDGYSIDPTRASMHAAAVSFQEQHGGADKTDYLTAAQAVQQH